MKRPKNKVLYARIRNILEAARTGLSRTVNTTQVIANWLIGREIVEEEQRGKRRAGYGERLVVALSRKTAAEFGKGYSVTNLEHFRDFYLTYPQLLSHQIPHAPRGESGIREIPRVVDVFSVEANSSKPRKKQDISHAPRGEFEIRHTLSGERWQPGLIHPGLSWTHYRMLLRVENADSRAFYEIKAAQSNWTARELERQINSLLYERLALSRDKKGLLRLAKKGQEIQCPVDIFKDPLVIEFLGLPESPRLREFKLEEALITNLQAFLLELGKGFAFVARQERITLDGDHFYIDLVFYHTVLKCYVLIDLLVGKLTHEDLGQLQLYVNYYDEKRRTAGDNPTLGLILCTDKNDAVVKYTLGPHQQRKIFASRYKLHLPTETELEAEIRREVRMLSGNPDNTSPPRSSP